MSSFWDDRFARTDYAYGVEPNRFLTTLATRLKPGMKALSVADGEGRNGVWLAQQGLDVVSVDASSVGLKKARKLAADRGVSVATTNANLLTWDWPRNQFDLVASIFIHFRPGDRERMHGAMERALKTGGLLALAAFTPDQLDCSIGGPPQPELLYTADILRRDFAQMKVLELNESMTELHEGHYHRGLSAVVCMVAQKVS